MRVYDPRQEKHIKKPHMEGLAVDLTGVEKEDRPGHCVSVKVRGVDSDSMESRARRDAERALAFLTPRKKREQPLRLSLSYAICDLDGKEVGAAGGHQMGENYSDTWAEFTEADRRRFGLWRAQAKPHPTVEKLLAALEWQRRASETYDSSEELLNSWFAMEHLVDKDLKVSLRIPSFLGKRTNGVGNEVSWVHNMKVAYLQLLLCIVELKYELNEYASSGAWKFLPTSSRLLYGLVLPKEISSLFIKD